MGGKFGKSEGGGANLWPKFWPRAFGRQRWPPLGALALQKVGPLKAEQSIRALARIWLEEVGGADLVGQGWWREVGGGSGRAKGPAEPGSGREKAASPPYTLCRPPPLLKARVEGASRPWLGPEVGRATGATFFPALCAGGLCLKEKRPWAHMAQSLGV